MSGTFPSTNPHPDWLTIPDAAERLSVSEKTVRRMIGSGEIRAERFGKRLIRVDAESLRGTPITIGALNEGGDNAA